MSPPQEIYVRFIRAVITDDEETAQQLSTPGFRADIADTGNELTLAEFLREMTIVREVLPNLGQEINVCWSGMRDGDFVIRYRMLATAQSTSSGGCVDVTSEDTVTFAGNLIEGVTIRTSLGAVIERLHP